ncbi:hypothetical protein AB0I68_24000 [Streptomyces sp. NPDC050448]|uniref:hypothetical protein n=1 Tax=Streptomyces sp. NPDC050448 TaxID=3155404 RepID=UPI00342A202E
MPDVGGDFYGVLPGFQVVRDLAVPPVVDTEVVGELEPVSEERAPVAAVPQAVTEAESEAADVTEAEPLPSMTVAGEIPGYDWETARAVVRNLGYEVVGRADASTVLLILGEGTDQDARRSGHVLSGPALRRCQRE